MSLGGILPFEFAVVRLTDNLLMVQVFSRKRGGREERVEWRKRRNFSLVKDSRMLIDRWW